MNIRRQSFSTSEHCVLSAWREQLAQAAQGLSQQLVQQAPQLLPRFAAYYTKLQQLPRRVRRRLQRQFRTVCRAHHFSANRTHPTRTQSLAGVALLLALGQAPALAATINVGGGCSLVNAINSANQEASVGGCTAGSGADTIVLPANSTRTLTTVNNTSYGPNGLPVISSAITIDGNGSTITRGNSAPNLRIFTVSSTGNLTLAETTVSQGVGAGAFPDNVGGGILNVQGTVKLINSTLSENRATAGGGLHNRGGTVSLNNSTVSGNDASYGGGGVDNHVSGVLTITNSTISGNSSTRGGMLNRESSTLTITNSTISGNEGGFFGGVANLGVSTLILSNSTVSGNSSLLNGGGIGNFDSSTATVSNSTISGNSALGSSVSDGGGVANYNSSTLILSDSTISGNSASGTGGGVANGSSILTLRRTLISGNTAPIGAEVRIVSSTINADNFNLIGHSGLTNAQAFTNFIPGASDIAATSNGNTPTALTGIVNPTLANNGGLTQTRALALGSPAVDAVAAGCSPPNTDQRGVPRPQDANNSGFLICDIGAFERVPPGTVTCDGLPATIVGTPASETITGTPGPDVIQGLGGNDLIRGLGGNDVVCGGSGNDRLFGGPGDDRLFGGAGTDRLAGELGFDRCDGGSPATGDTAASCEPVRNVP